jgi:hypothetical protein
MVSFVVIKNLLFQFPILVNVIINWYVYKKGIVSANWQAQINTWKRE